VSYLVISGPCTVVSNLIHANQVGTCKITAYQHGDANYKLALDKSRSLVIIAAKTTTLVTAESPVAFGTTLEIDAAVTGDGGPVNTGVVKFYSDKTTLVGQAPVASGEAQYFLSLPNAPTTLRVHAVYVPAGGDWTTSTSPAVVVRVV